MAGVDWRFFETSPDCVTEFIRQDTPIPAGEMAKRELEQSTVADAIRRCEHWIEHSCDEEEADYWRQVQKIVASSPEPSWHPPYSAEEMASELVEEEGLGEALAMCRSELRRRTEPEAIRYFERVQSLIQRRLPATGTNPLSLL